MGFENIRPGDIFCQRGNGKGLLIDLRQRADYRNSHVPGAVCIPYEELRQSIPKLRNWYDQCMRRFGSASLIVYCDRGNTSLRAARDLNNQGFYVKNVYGGISAYQGPRADQNGMLIIPNSVVDGTGKSR